MTTEEKIAQVLKPLIDEVKKDVFVNPDNADDEETLGIIIAKYLDWSGIAIQNVALAAFEDANFHNVEISGVEN